MPRDANGDYTFPPGSGNPVQSNTVIDVNWANPTMADIQAALTDSLSRSGQGGMTGAFPLASGAVNDPQLTWSDEPTMGLYRPTDATMSWTISGADAATITAERFSVPYELYCDGAIIAGPGANTNGLWIEAGFASAGYVKTQYLGSSYYTIANNGSGQLYSEIDLANSEFGWTIGGASNEVMNLSEESLDLSLDTLNIDSDTDASGNLTIQSNLRGLDIGNGGGASSHIRYLDAAGNPIRICINFRDDGSTGLQHLNNPRLDTTATGVAVTGEVTTSGINSSDVPVVSTNAAFKQEYDGGPEDGTGYWIQSSDATGDGYVKLQAGNSGFFALVCPTAGGSMNYQIDMVNNQHEWWAAGTLHMTLEEVNTNEGALRMTNMPTNPAGLASGTLWNNAGVVNIV